MFIFHFNFKKKMRFAGLEQENVITNNLLTVFLDQQNISLNK